MFCLFNVYETNEYTCFACELVLDVLVWLYECAQYGVPPHMGFRNVVIDAITAI